jgi:hypothetical protein
MLHCVVLVITNVSKEGSVFIIRVPRIGELRTTLAVNSNLRTLRRNTILYFIILYYTIVYHTILYCTILYYTILYYTILYYTVLYCVILYYTIVFICSVLRLLVTANVVPSSSNVITLMMQAIRSAETLILTIAIRRNIPEDGILQRYVYFNFTAGIFVNKTFGMNWNLIFTLWRKKYLTIFIIFMMHC